MTKAQVARADRLRKLLPVAEKYARECAAISRRFKTGCSERQDVPAAVENGRPARPVCSTSALDAVAKIDAVNRFDPGVLANPQFTGALLADVRQQLAA